MMHAMHVQRKQQFRNWSSLNSNTMSKHHHFEVLCTRPSKKLQYPLPILGAWSWSSEETGASGAFIWIEIWEEWRMEAWEEGNSRPFPGSDTGGGRWCVGCYVRHLPHLHLKLGGRN
ncbi:uncharacterized protein [Triticum aestivum]|uniref:uncharacterized protein n=1 Tax=Triticum aestivum TaxID=4565 RepID=UPI001D0080D0|nr:uncharacterized protein LOC123191692 [Triticum aestivum]